MSRNPVHRLGVSMRAAIIVSLALSSTMCAKSNSSAAANGVSESPAEGPGDEVKPDWTKSDDALAYLREVQANLESESVAVRACPEVASAAEGNPAVARVMLRSSGTIINLGTQPECLERALTAAVQRAGVPKSPQGGVSIAVKAWSSGGITAEYQYVLGALDKAVIDKTIRANMAAIKSCYNAELRDTPRLRGSLVVKFTILADGSVGRAEVKSTELARPAMEACVTNQFRMMEFPHPKGGGLVIVSYPLVFSPT